MQSVENITVTFSIIDTKVFKIKMLNWANRFNIFCFLDNHDYTFEQPAFDCMLAAGAIDSVTANSLNEIHQIKSFHEQHPGWLFGHFNYPSPIPDEMGFPAAFFFNPSIMVSLSKNIVTITAAEVAAIDVFTEIEQQDEYFTSTAAQQKVSIKSKQSKAEYIQTIQTLKKHIQKGDCYEINYCQEFFSKSASINPLFFYQQLSSLSPNPFAALYKLEDSYCMCASPERFIKKIGETIISQPIKGTSKRNNTDVVADELAKNYLINSAKEKSENVMIVDLVRNDLSRICKKGSVVVKELFGIYSFPQVHQMISTIQGTVKEDLHWTNILEACYPMGSMTGAPKVRVMELIEKFEASPRGLFSGTIGYITPKGDFDFNVVIRSLFYNNHSQRLSFKVGGGITFYSDPESEFEECMIKASAIMNILQSE